jgi:thiamine biosynthesis lipoprotein
MKSRVVVRLVGSLLMSSAAASLRAEPLVISGPTMGTTYRVQLVDGVEHDVDKSEAPLRAAIDATLADVDRRLSTYRNDSEISRFNRAPAGDWFAVSPATAELVAKSLEMSRQTGGALDVTVGPLVRLWHFGPAAIADANVAAGVTPPTEAEILAARKLIGHEKLAVRSNPPGLRKQMAGLEVDLSAVGEGDAIDRLAAMLTRRGQQNFLIELGGEVRASGERADGRPWRVAVERPTADRPSMEVALPLINAALATSGDYRRYFEYNGRRYSHIIDPATGRPIDHTLASVTVVANDSLTADAWDTAILVLGPQRGYECAVTHGIAALLISRDGDRFVAQETPAWHERFSSPTHAAP